MPGRWPSGGDRTPTEDPHALSPRHRVRILGYREAGSEAASERPEVAKWSC